MVELNLNHYSPSTTVVVYFCSVNQLFITGEAALVQGGFIYKYQLAPIFLSHHQPTQDCPRRSPLDAPT